MANKPQLPTFDPVQSFCMNFKSHRDLSDLSSRRIPDVHWPEPFDKDLQLRISRYTLEIFQIILAKSKDYEKLAEEECKHLISLARQVLEFYSPSPINRICRCDLIADALINVRLVDEKQAILENQVTEKVREWLKQATDASMKMLLEILEKEDSEKEDSEKEDSEKEDSEKEDSEKEDSEKEDSEKEDSEKQKMYKNFKGETDWIFVNGMVCWGSTRTLSGEFYHRVFNLR